MLNPTTKCPCIKIDRKYNNKIYNLYLQKHHSKVPSSDHVSLLQFLEFHLSQHHPFQLLPNEVKTNKRTIKHRY